MAESPHLGLPFLEAGQAQKHVTHNEALRVLDALVQLSVVAISESPSGAPEEGERHIVAEGASGSFASKDGQVAVYEDGAWRFLMPRAGWLAFVKAENRLLVFAGDDWAPFPVSELQGLALLGLGTDADAFNPFSAKLNKALWTARYTGEGGDGDLRYTLNKESSEDVLSLLLQSNWSGRAELGLIGDDDLRFKVSPDGSAWHDAIVIDRATGRPRFPSGGVREVLQANRTYYVAPGGSNANSGLSAGAPLQTIAAAVAKCYQIDSNGFNVAIQLADGTYAISGVPINITRPIVGGARLDILGNPAAPQNVIVQGSYPTAMAATGANVALRHMRLESNGSGSLIHADSKATVFIDNLIFTDAARFHIEISNGASLTVLGDYAINGSASVHIYIGSNGVVDGPNRTMTLNGTLSFGSRFVGAATGGVYSMFNATWNVAGTVTGKRYEASLNGVINTSGKGANHFPGDVAGTTATGGQYG